MIILLSFSYYPLLRREIYNQSAEKKKKRKLVEK